MPVVETKRREQLNISLRSESTLARRLSGAEAVTGQPRAQIARSVIDAFLETWLRAEEVRQQAIVAAMETVDVNHATVVTVREVGKMQPPRRDQGYQFQPAYWQAVDARRPMVTPMRDQISNVPVRDVGRMAVRPRALVPAPDYDEVPDASR